MLDLNFKSIKSLLRTFSDEQKCIDFLEDILWHGNPVSPFDPTSKVYKCKNGKYKCKNTMKYFTVKTGTIFEGTKVELQDWFIALWLFSTHKGGLSSMELSRHIEVAQKTAWLMLQKIRTVSNYENYSNLYNEVEIDETYIGGKNKNRHANKKVKKSQGRSIKDKIPVLGMIERKGKVVAMVVPNTTAKELIPRIIRTVECCSTVYTDEWPAYKKLDDIYKHYVVNHGEGQYVDGEVHTNNIECFWGNLKRGITGVWRTLSPKHLQLYVDEFVFRRNTCKLEPRERFINLINQVKGYRLTYKQLTNAS